MNRIGILLVFAAAACGHSNNNKSAYRSEPTRTPKYEGYGESHTKAEAPTMPSPPTSEPVTPTETGAPTDDVGSPVATGQNATPTGNVTGNKTGMQGTGDKNTDVFGGTTAPAPTPSTPAAPETKIARAELKSIKDGSSMGTITFTDDGTGQITITADFTGLGKKSTHALYIHENGDCSNKAKKVGPHLNPTKAKHGGLASSMRHAGDFGNITADEAGDATFSTQTDSITIDGANPDSVVGRAVVIHAKKDDKKGSGGAALACGVVEMEGADTGETSDQNMNGDKDNDADDMNNDQAQDEDKSGTQPSQNKGSDKAKTPGKKY